MSTSGFDFMPPGLPHVIDVEASGFGPGSYPIEVGLAMGNGARCCELIRPEPGWNHWDLRAEALHGLSRTLLKARGRAVSEVADTLNQMLGRHTVYSDAWGADIAWLGRLFDAADSVMSFRLESIYRESLRRVLAVYSQAIRFRI